MSLILLNLLSNQQIKLSNDTPLIIGRGNVEGCFDKRVSRNHGRITCTVDGKVRLAALNCNPCFFSRNGVPPIQQLNKDEEETLNEGDYLGLLPNAFWFKVTSNKETNVKNESDNFATQTNVPSGEVNETIILKSNLSSSNSREITVSEESASKFTAKLMDSSNSLLTVASNKESNSVCTLKDSGTSEFEKTKKLPLWMYQIDDISESNKSPNKHCLENATYAKGKKQKVLSETEIKNEFKTKVTDEIKGRVKVRNSDIPSTSKIESVDEVTSLPGKNAVEANFNNKKKGYESDVDYEKDLSTKRPICQYEGNCYRKNPLHKLDFCHPGDSDYIPYEERPLCHYGDACYRKSEIHKIKFRHSSLDTNLHNPSSPSLTSGSRASSPLPAKRRRKNINIQNSHYEDDEYDLEDPFINDATSDEYIPSDLDEEEDCLDTS